MKKLVFMGLLCLALLPGCATKEYMEAVKSQNVAMMQMHHDNTILQGQQEAARQERQATMNTAAIAAATKTSDKTDDMLVPMMIMMQEQLYAFSRKPVEMPALQRIEKPEEFGDVMQKGAGLTLGIGGIVAGVYQSSNMRDIAVAGINGAGTHQIISGKGNTANNDSMNVGSKNVVGGNQKVSGNSGGGAAAAGADPESELLSKFKTCTDAGGTMGNVGSCLAMAGEDVEIKGGQMYVDGELFSAGNSYSGYVPVAE